VGRDTVYTQGVQRCANFSSTAPVDYWDVGYNFRGYEHYVQTTSPPDRTIRGQRAGRAARLTIVARNKISLTPAASSPLPRP